MPENMAGSTVSPRRFLFLLRRLWAETFRSPFPERVDLSANGRPQV